MPSLPFEASASAAVVGGILGHTRLCRMHTGSAQCFRRDENGFHICLHLAE